MKIVIAGIIVLVAAIMGISTFSSVMSSEPESIMVQAIDCNAPEGMVCVAPDRERDGICDTDRRFNIPQDTANELNVFANTCTGI